MTEVMSSITLEQKLTVLKEHKIPAGKAVGCIDDRPIVDGLTSSDRPDLFVSSREKGPQLLGGSLILLPVLAETAILAGKKPQELDIDDLIKITFEAHQSLAMTPTVHMDNHHGELTNEQVIGLTDQVKVNTNAKLSGCGFAGLVTSGENRLGLSEPVAELFQNHSDLVERLVRAGARVIVLSGNHADKDKGEALAVRNNDRQFTLNTNEAHKNKAQAYNHDDWFFEDLIGRAIEVLEARREVEWVKQLRTNAKDLNENWLKITTNILAGMDPVSIS